MLQLIALIVAPSAALIGALGGPTLTARRDGRARSLQRRVDAYEAALRAVFMFRFALLAGELESADRLVLHQRVEALHSAAVSAVLYGGKASALLMDAVTSELEGRVGTRISEDDNARLDEVLRELVNCCRVDIGEPEVSFLRA